MSADVDAARRRAFGRRPSPAEAGGADFDRDVADFRQAGLSVTVAESAAQGLRRGTYESFEDAATRIGVFVGGPGARCDRAALEEVLRRREAAAGTTVVES